MIRLKFAKQKKKLRPTCITFAVPTQVLMLFNRAMKSLESFHRYHQNSQMTQLPHAGQWSGAIIILSHFHSQQSTCFVSFICWKLWIFYYQDENSRVSYSTKCANLFLLLLLIDDDVLVVVVSFFCHSKQSCNRWMGVKLTEGAFD